MQILTCRSVRGLILFVVLIIIAAWQDPVCADEIEVSTAIELSDAVGSSIEGDIILLEDGVYNLSESGTIVVRTNGLTIQSKNGDRSAVVVEGWGMTADGHNGFWISGDDVIIADLTIQNVGYHCIQTDVAVDRLIVSNCILRNAGQQILTVPSKTGAEYSDDGLVEGCLFEYTAGEGPQYHIGGIDVHHGKNWVVRDNRFQFIRSPGSQVAEHAIHFWNNSEGTLVERNWIFNCDRGIGFGDSAHTGGTIRNNMIAHNGAPLADGSAGKNDVGIGLESARGAQVYNNTIFFLHAYNAIEYRFSATTGVIISSNLTNRAILQRDGAAATLETNITDAEDGWFVDVSKGDLHLAASVSRVVDQANALDLPTDDFDQDPRPQASGIDIGADEMMACVVDQDADGDVDGKDLAATAGSMDIDCVSACAQQFGQ
jgi:hypothetical protein